MRKITTTFGLICLVIGLFWFATRLISPEDTWLCVNGQWVKHGVPRDPHPTTGCEPESSPSTTLGASEAANQPSESSPTGLANPAAVNCLTVGGNWQPEAEGSAQGTAGYCQFSDGSQCEEWALYRKECSAGQYQPKKWAGQIKAYTPEAPFKYFLQTLANENFSLKPLEKGDPEVWQQVESLADKDASAEITGYPDPQMPGVILVKSVKTNE